MPAAPARGTVEWGQRAGHPPTGWGDNVRRWGLSHGGRLVAGLLLTGAVAAGACGGNGDGAPSPIPLQPIDEILAGPITIEHLGEGAAVLRVETTIDVICSVVYGEDQRYGSQSTDVDMLGGLPHAQHGAPLRGLLTDTLYHFRLQGAAPDGALYISEDLTFRTPLAPEPEEEPAQEREEASASAPGLNLASSASGARVIALSSTFANDPRWAGENAIDGDPLTEWASDGDGDDAFITIALRDAAQLSAIGLWTRSMGATAQIQHFQVITESGTVLGPFEVVGADALQTYPISVRAQRLRFEVVASSGGNTGLVELAVFAAE